MCITCSREQKFPAVFEASYTIRIQHLQNHGLHRSINYLIAALVAISAIYILPDLIAFPEWYIKRLLFTNRALIGSLGGVLYCLRAIYLNKSVFIKDGMRIAM